MLFLKKLFDYSSFESLLTGDNLILKTSFNSTGSIASSFYPKELCNESFPDL